MKASDVEAARANRAERTRAGAEPVVGVDDVYMSVSRDLPKYSGLSVRTLRSYLTHRSHPLPYFKIGGKILVRRSDFDRWAERFRAVAPSAIEDLVKEALQGF